MASGTIMQLLLSFGILGGVFSAFAEETGGHLIDSGSGRDSAAVVDDRKEEQRKYRITSKVRVPPGFTRMTLASKVTIREKSGNHLRKIADIYEGSVIAFNAGNPVGRQRYRNDQGQVLMSNRGWFQGAVVIESNDLSRHEITRINKKKLYVSEDVQLAGHEDQPRRERYPRRGYGDRRCQQTFADKGVPRGALESFFRGFARYKRRLGNREWASIVDYSKRSSNSRYYLLNLDDCRVYKKYVAHGSGKQDGVHRGDPDNDGDLDRCKWKGRTLNMTRPGFVIVRGWHQSQKNWTYLNRSANAKGLKLHGLQSMNEEVLSRGVVMHESYKVKNQSRKQGRSFGCVMFANGHLKELLGKTNNQLKNGTLLYKHTPQCGVN